MAAYEGFLTSIYAGKDLFRPTFFELIAQEQLDEVFQPALRFLVDIFRQRSGGTGTLLSTLLDSWEVLYTTFRMILEGYHLRYHGATFAEHFFGLRRYGTTRTTRNKTPLETLEQARQRSSGPPLTLKQQVTSLMAVVLLPWCFRKCAERFRQLEATSADGWFYRWYPAAHAAKALVNFGYRLLYLMEQTEIWSPALHVLGLKLSRHFPEASLAEDKVQSLAIRMQDLVKLCGQASLWGIVYVLQFLQWWYQREHLLQPLRPRKPPPPPPQRFPYPEIGRAGVRLVVLPEDRTICPLCHRPRQNPAMSCGGYAFCYTCLVPHVQNFGHCPVSGQQMMVEEIRRIRDEA